MRLLTDVVLEMFIEGSLFPTIEQVAERSGLSRRSVHVYFANSGELFEAAICRSNEETVGAGCLEDIGEGPLDHRIGAFATMRVRLHERAGPVWRATVHHSTLVPHFADELKANRLGMSDQLLRQFATELDAMDAEVRALAIEAAHMVTQLEAIDLLRRDRELDVAQTEAVLVSALTAILGH